MEYVVPSAQERGDGLYPPPLYFCLLPVHLIPYVLPSQPLLWTSCV